MGEYLDLIGKVLMFISFCLLTPEFLQPATLQRLTEYGASSIALIGAFLVWLLTFVVVCWALADQTEFTSPPWETKKKALDFNPADGGFPKLPNPPPRNPDAFEFILQYLGFHVEKAGWFLTAAIKLGMLAMIIAIPIVMARLTRDLFETHIVTPALKWLAKSDKEPERLAKVGVGFFLVGSCFDLLGWLLASK